MICRLHGKLLFVIQIVIATWGTIFALVGLRKLRKRSKAKAIKA